MNFIYLGALFFSLAGMIILDWRYKLAFWHDLRRATLTVFIPVGIFVIWDILGIALGIFWAGTTPFSTGIMLGPEFPLEELFFLTFLCYFTLNTYRIAERIWQPTSS